MSPLLVFVLAGIGTYTARAVFIVAVGDRHLPEKAERLLRNVGPAVLAALTASLLTAGRLPEFAGSLPEIAGVAAGILVAVWRRSLFPTFIAGVTVWFFFDLLV